MASRTASRPPTPTSSSPRGHDGGRTAGARKPARQATTIIVESETAPGFAGRFPNAGKAARSTSAKTAMVTATTKTRENS